MHVVNGGQPAHLASMARTVSSSGELAAARRYTKATALRGAGRKASTVTPGGTGGRPNRGSSATTSPAATKAN